jgi:Ca2+-transporting ATPase
MMFQLFNVYNCRSSWRSGLSGFFETKWLLAAVALSLVMHMLVIYVPIMQTAFHTVALTLNDWLIAAGIGSTLLIAVELAKIVLRAKRRAAPAAGVEHAPERSPSRA